MTETPAIAVLSKLNIIKSTCEHMLKGGTMVEDDNIGSCIPEIQTTHGFDYAQPGKSRWENLNWSSGKTLFKNGLPFVR